jgi:hypothetical protein
MKVNVLLYYNYYYICLKLLSQALRRPWTAVPVGFRRLLLLAGASQGPGTRDQLAQCQESRNIRVSMNIRVSISSFCGLHILAP